MLQCQQMTKLRKAAQVTPKVGGKYLVNAKWGCLNSYGWRVARYIECRSYKSQPKNYYFITVTSLQAKEVARDVKTVMELPDD